MANSEGDKIPHQATVKVGKDSGLSIPLAFRKALGVSIGDEVILYSKDGELRVKTMKGRIEPDTTTRPAVRKAWRPNCP